MKTKFKIVELRHVFDFSYVFRDKLRLGSTLDDVFEVIGYPKKIVQGEKNSFEDGVLYKDIDGRKGHCYYARSDQNVRLWFSDYKIGGIYMTRSDYGARQHRKSDVLALSLMTSAGLLWMLYLEYVRGKDAEDPESHHLLCDHYQVISKWGIISKKPVSFDSVPKFQEQVLAIGESL